MNESANRRNPPATQSAIPVTIYDEANAKAAWMEYVEAKVAADLARAKADRAHERFMAAFVAGAA